MPEVQDPLKQLETRALAFLARREYTRMELIQRLAATEIPPNQVAALMDKLEAQGYLSDARAAEAIVNARKGQRGILRITQELEQKGVSPETLQDNLHETLAELKKNQIRIASEVWRKKFSGLPVNANERGKQTRFLASRGFSFDVIRELLSGADSFEDFE